MGMRTRTLKEYAGLILAMRPSEKRERLRALYQLYRVNNKKPDTEFRDKWRTINTTEPK